MSMKLTCWGVVGSYGALIWAALIGHWILSMDRTFLHIQTTDKWGGIMMIISYERPFCITCPAHRECEYRARFLSLAWSKLRLCSANHRPGYWSNLPCDWPSTAWAYSGQETENGPWSVAQGLQCTCPISHNAPFCNRNVHMCAHFCCKMVHCGTFDELWDLLDGSTILAKIWGVHYKSGQCLPCIAMFDIVLYWL